MIRKIPAQWLTLMAGLFFVLCTGVVQDLTRRLGTADLGIVNSPVKYIGVSVDPRVLRRLLGLRLVAADLIWIDTLIKDDSKREKLSYTDFYKSFKTILELDPDRVFAYYVGGMYLSVIKDDIKGASAILRMGTDYLATHETSWDESWKIPFTLGYNLIFEEHEFDEGARWVGEAARMNGTPEYVQRLARTVVTEQGRLELGARLLSEMRQRVTTTEARAQIEKKMVALALRQELFDLNEKFEKFLNSTGASAFSRKRQWQLFLRANGLSGKDFLGRSLGINATGKIAIQ